MRNVAGRNLWNTHVDRQTHSRLWAKQLLIHPNAMGKKNNYKIEKTYILHTEKPSPRIKARWGRTRYNEYTDQGKWSSISTQGYMNLFLLWGEFVWKSTRISINCRIENSTWISVSASNQLSVILYLSYSCFVKSEVPLSLSGGILPGHVRSKVRMPGSDEAGVLKELDEDLVDKLVLGDGLHHQHPLLPQPWQHGRNLHWLKGREEERDGHWKQEIKRGKGTFNTLRVTK